MGYQIDLDEYQESRLVAELDRRQRARRAGMCDYCGYPAGESIPIYQRPPDRGPKDEIIREYEPTGGGTSCKEYGRHRGEVG